MRRKRFFIFVIFTIFISFLTINSDKKILFAQEEQTTFIHSAGRTSSILLSNEGVVYGWGLWGEASNVTLSILLMFFQESNIVLC